MNTLAPQKSGDPWLYARLLHEPAPRVPGLPEPVPGHGLDTVVTGQETDRIQSLSIPGWIATSPGDLPARLLGTPPAACNSRDGSVMNQMMQNDVHTENELRFRASRSNRGGQPLKVDLPSGLADNVAQASGRRDYYASMRSADDATLLINELVRKQSCQRVREEQWKTELLASFALGALPVMLASLISGFDGGLGVMAGLATGFGTAWLLKPVLDRRFRHKVASDVRKEMEEPLKYWQGQTALRVEARRRVQAHLTAQLLPHLPLPPPPVPGLQVRPTDVVIGGVRLKKKG